MIKANVILDHLGWKNKIIKPNNYITKRLNKLSKLSQFKNKKQEFTIFLTNNNKIKKLNKKFRKKDKSTDVLSFPFYTNTEIRNLKNRNVYLGDVILNFYKIDKKNFKKDFNRLWIHGFLHLLGYKHYKDKDYHKMNRIEKLILKKIEDN